MKMNYVHSKVQLRNALKEIKEYFQTNKKYTKTTKIP